MSKDKRWIVTADAGEDSILVVWDSYSGEPMRTISSPHPRGVVALDLSHDARFVAVLSAFTSDAPQEVYIFEWSREEGSVPLLAEGVIADDAQHTVKFDDSNHSEIATTGNRSVSFWNWDTLHLEGYTATHPQTVRSNFTCRFALPHITPQ